MTLETSILRRGLEQLRGVLPTGWDVQAAPTVPDVDLLATLTGPDGARRTLVLEVKTRLAASAARSIAARLAQVPDATGVVVVPWLSPATQDALRGASIGFLDFTGNIELRVDRPGLYVKTSGADHDPNPPVSALRTLKGAGAARAVRALVDHTPPYGIRELATRSGASAAVLSRVVDLLGKLDLLSVQESIVDVRWPDVLDRWCEDYAVLTSNRVLTCLDPRGAQALTRRLPESTAAYAATGTLGVPPEARVAPPQLVMLYTTSPEQTARALGLTPTAQGANVVLLEPRDDGAFARAQRGQDGIVRAAPSQVVADLRTGPGRGSAEADALRAWMVAHEDTWRVSA